MLENVIKKLFPIRDEEDRPCTFPTFASQVFFNDGSVLEGKQFGGGTATVDPLDKFEIGVIYHFAIDVNPPEKYGGTWEQIKGRFLIGTGMPENNDDGTSPGSYNYAAGSKGGEEKHKLTVNETASHRHTDRIQWQESGTTTSNVASVNNTPIMPVNGIEGYMTIDAADQQGIGLAGGDQPHNNMPPYLVVNMWKRVS